MMKTKYARINNKSWAMFLTVEAHQLMVGCVSIQHSLIRLPKLFNTGVLIILSGMKVAIDLETY